MAQLDMGNGFSIDMDDVPKFVQALEDQKQRLQDTWMQVYTAEQTDSSGATPPPANDDYSGVWSMHANQTVQSYLKWNKDQQDSLQSLIDKVNTVVANYKQTEQNNTMRS